MIYLSGSRSGVDYTAHRPDFGIMLQPSSHTPMPPPPMAWAADNGCYAQGERFKADRWLVWLERRTYRAATCLFAVAPDVVGDAVATWQRSAPYLPTIRHLGYRAAYVAQDGIERLCVAWDAFDCLFVGGSTAWKLTHGYDIAVEAKRRGKWTHLGRVNSFRRLRSAHAGAYDSADGTYVAFGPDRNLPRVYDWLDRVNQQARWGSTGGGGAW